MRNLPPDLAAVAAAWPILAEPIRNALAKLSRDWSELSADRQAGTLAMIQALVAFIGSR